MVRVYGVSDSELSFVALLKSYLKEIEIDSYEDYQDYKDNYRDKKKEIEEEYDESIKEDSEAVTRCYHEIKQYEYDLRKVEWTLRKKEAIVNRYNGPLKERIKNEMDELRSKKRRLSSAISNRKEEVVDARSEKDDLTSEKREKLSNFDRDIGQLFFLEKNEKFTKKRQGMWGEKKVIEHISKGFGKEKMFNLINGLNFDVIGGGININDSTKVETQIDHVLVCPKGIYFIETKHWKADHTYDLKKGLFEQLDKIKATISYIFDGKLKEDTIKILLVGTEKKIDLGSNSDFVSLKLDELKSYLMKQEDVLTKGEIIMVLSEFSKYLPKDKFPDYPRRKLGLSSWFIKMKRKKK